MTPSGAVRKIARAARGASVLVLAVSLLGGCYGFSGGGGLPKQLKTVAIEPFDNQTAVPELQREVFEQLRAALRERLNLREAPAARADVVVRGTLVKYDVDLPAGLSADGRQTTSTRRRLIIVLDVEIIDQTTGRTLLSKKGLQLQPLPPFAYRRNCWHLMVCQRLQELTR